MVAPSLLLSLFETCLVNNWICFHDMVSSQRTEISFLNTPNNFRFSFLAKVEENYLTNFEAPITLLELKRNVSMGLLTHALNAKKEEAGRACRIMPFFRPSTEPGTKHRKNRLSVRDDIRFSRVGLHLPSFKRKRGRCEWFNVQAM